MEYAIGLDFGTGSVRAVAMEAKSGKLLGNAEEPYTVYTTLPDSHIALKPRMVLAEPKEYLEAMEHVFLTLLKENDLRGEDAVGIGVDTTSLTLVALGRDGLPLTFHQKFRNEPNAYMKLWKSRSAEKEAEQIQKVAVRRKEPALSWNGGVISSEWLLPKALETFHEAPEVFRKADLMMDLSDYIPFALTGKVTRNAGSYLFKAMAYDGCPPSEDFLEDVEPGFGALHAKLRGYWVRWGERIGGLSTLWAKKTGLREGIAVSSGALDGNMPMVAFNLQQKGDMLLTLGTSGVLSAISRRQEPILGCAGGGQDVMIPGCFGCECGMAAMGDLYDWSIRQCLSPQVFREADHAGMKIHDYLAETELKRVPKESDIMALDWWNGHRGPLSVRNVYGVFAGMSLHTTGAELYRAVVEATAFCTKMNLENLERQGLMAERIIVCGGIAEKNPILVQLFSDVLGKPLLYANLPHSAACGAAIMGINAAEKGSSASLPETMNSIAMIPVYQRFQPDGKRHQIFAKRYNCYVNLSRLMQNYWSRQTTKE
ncbi:MAG: ribulokinase [Clostridia bacterium]|nr:ribulokinase [Clostridia bacterium]